MTTKPAITSKSKQPKTIPTIVRSASASSEVFSGINGVDFLSLSSFMSEFYYFSLSESLILSSIEDLVSSSFGVISSIISASLESSSVIMLDLREKRGSEVFFSWPFWLTKEAGTSETILISAVDWPRTTGMLNGHSLPLLSLHLKSSSVLLSSPATMKRTLRVV